MGGFQPLVQRSHPPALSTVCLSLEGHIFFFCLDLNDLEQLRLPSVSQLVWRNSLRCQTCGNPRPFPCADSSTEHMQESSMLPKPCGAHGGCTLWCLYAQTSLGSPDHKHEVSLSPSLIKPRQETVGSAAGGFRPWSCRVPWCRLIITLLTGSRLCYTVLNECSSIT